MIVLNTDTTYYSPEKAGENSITVRELIERLSCFDPDEKVVFGVITYGQVKTVQKKDEA